jgi:hypothetical protein
MDMTSERSYAEVNKEFNKVVPRGKAYFSAGATILKPDLQVFKDVLALQAEFRAKIPQARHMVDFELYPTAEIQEVENEEMAFSCRGPQSNVIINVNWSAEDVDKVDVGVVRKKVRDIVGAIQGDQPVSEVTYGNYGKSLHNAGSDADDSKKVIRSWGMSRFESFSEAIIENSRLSRPNTSESSQSMRHGT